MGASMTETEIKIGLALAPILTAIATTALGILGLVVGDWRQRRTQAGRRKLALEEAGREVTFAKEWLAARKLVGDSPEEEQQATSHALAWLEQASARVAESNRTPVKQRPAITLRRLFLAYPMQSRAARLLRVAFYVCLSLAPIYVGPIAYQAGTPEVEVEWSLLVVVLCLMGGAMVLRAGALHAEDMKHHIEKATLRRAFLLYRFRRPAAKLVRFIFYIWVAFAILHLTSMINMAFVLGELGGRESPLSFKQFLFVNFGFFVGWVGWAVILRHWAVSLESRAGNDVSRLTTLDTPIDKVIEKGPVDLTGVELIGPDREASDVDPYREVSAGPDDRRA